MEDRAWNKGAGQKGQRNDERKLHITNSNFSHSESFDKDYNVSLFFI